jgi:hypothetical protein
MKKVPDQNSTDSAEIEALITRLVRGQFRDGDAQLLARLLGLRILLVMSLDLSHALPANLLWHHTHSPKADIFSLRELSFGLIWRIERQWQC